MINNNNNKVNKNSKCIQVMSTVAVQLLMKMRKYKY